MRSSASRRLGILPLIVLLLNSCGTPGTGASPTASRQPTPPIQTANTAFVAETRSWNAHPVVAELYTSVSMQADMDSAWARMPQLVVYADGTVITARDNSDLRTVEMGAISPDALCGLLRRIESNGFFEFTQADYPEPQITHMGTTIIRVDAWRSNEIAAYALRAVLNPLADSASAATVPAPLADTYTLLESYRPANAAPYQPERIALWVEKAEQTNSAALWPLADISLSTLTADQRQAPEIVLDGQQAADFYAQYAGRIRRLYDENGQIYEITMRPLLPRQRAPREEFPTEPTAPLTCDSAIAVIPPAATPAPPTATPSDLPSPFDENAQSPLVEAGAGFGQRDQPGQFEIPSNVVVNPSGEVIATDERNQRLQVFALDGALRSSLPLTTSNLTDLAALPDGGLLVADHWSNKLEIRAADGRLLRTVRGWPPPETLSAASDASFVAYATWIPNGGLALTEYDGERVVMLNADGSVREIWTGPAERPLRGISALDTGDDGTLYVAAADENRVVLRHPDGRIDDLSINNPQMIAAAADGALYVAQWDRQDGSGPSHITLYDSRHAQIGSWTLGDLPPDHSKFIIDIADAPDGSIVVLGRATIGEEMAAVIHHYRRDGAHLASFGSNLIQPGQFESHAAFAVSRLGDAWVFDNGDEPGRKRPPDRLLHLDASNGHLATFEQLDGQGFACDTYLIAAMASQHVVIADTCAGTVARFDAAGALVSRWGRRGRDPGSYDLIAGLALAPDEQSLYILDSGQQALFQVGLDGAPINRWSAQELGADAPGALAINGDGSFVLIDSASGQLVASGPGGPRTSWPLPDPAHWPYRVAVDAERGRIYVSAATRDNPLFDEGISNSDIYLYVFDRDGTYLGRHYTSFGYADGLDLALAPGGRLLRGTGFRHIAAYLPR